MIAAMAAAVSATSTLRLASGRTGLSGDSALAEGVGPLDAWTGAGVAKNGPPNATGFAVGAVATAGGLLTGAPVWPTE
jgi:hypothetical protein